ncbi:MAG: BTAD domain-containing putative transcriptional regulator [Acidimicrobiales bacterium]
MWRGPALAEFADEPWARPEAARLEELRDLAAVTCLLTRHCSQLDGGQPLTSHTTLIDGRSMVREWSKPCHGVGSVDR